MGMELSLRHHGADLLFLLTGAAWAEGCRELATNVPDPQHLAQVGNQRAQSKGFPQVLVYACHQVELVFSQSCVESREQRAEGEAEAGSFP